jgi:hypothetical protein
MKHTQTEIDKYFNNIKEEIENGHSILLRVKSLNLTQKWFTRILHLTK